MLVSLALSPSAVVGVGESVAGAIDIVLDFFCRVCVTCLRECGLGCGYHLAYSSLWWIAMGGGFTLSYPSWVVDYVVSVCRPDTQTLDYKSRGWYISRCTAG